MDLDWAAHDAGEGGIGSSSSSSYDVGVIDGLSLLEMDGRARRRTPWCDRRELFFAQAEQGAKYPDRYLAGDNTTPGAYVAPDSETLSASVVREGGGQGDRKSEAHAWRATPTLVLGATRGPTASAG